MIEGIASILKIAYFSNQKKKAKEGKGFCQYRPVNARKLSKLNPQLTQLCELIKSDTPCENWIFMFETHKHNYVVQELIYNLFIEGTMNAHNLFLMLIQCKVFPTTVWLPIENLCRLSGARKNEICCLVHYTVSNMATSTSHNPKKWPNKIALRELGDNFSKIYSNALPFEQKIMILPMIVVLNNKNSEILWRKLNWLENFPRELLNNLRSNLTRILEPQLGMSTTLSEPDYLTQQIYSKSLQLLEIEGFISSRNLFAHCYQVYNIPLLLELLSEYQPCSSTTFKLELMDFLIELFDSMEVFGFDLMRNESDKDFGNLSAIVVKNRLYLTELGNIGFTTGFLQELLRVAFYENPNNAQPQKFLSSNLAKTVPRCSSQIIAKQIHPLTSQEEPISTYQQLLKETKQTLLTHLLSQLYQLKTDYLKLIYSILQDCFHNLQQEAWSESSSSFVKLQLYLMNEYLLQFLVQNYNALQSKNRNDYMLAYYGVLGWMLKNNPIVYGKLDSILQTELTHQNKSTNSITRFLKSFLNNIAESRHTILIVLSDQFEWRENIQEKYPNSAYQSYFVGKVIDECKLEWLIKSITYICCFHLEGCENAGEEMEHKYESITFLLALYYYFEELHETSLMKPKKTPSQRILQKQEFLNRLYTINASNQCCTKCDRRILKMLTVHLQQWERHYNLSKKNRIMEYGLNYPMLRLTKQKLKNKITGFMKRRDFEQNQLTNVQEQINRCFTPAK